MYSSVLSLTLALDGGSGQSHALATLPPRRRPGTRCTGGWVGCKTGLDGCRKSHTYWALIPRPSTPQWIAILTMLSRTMQRLGNIKKWRNVFIIVTNYYRTYRKMLSHNEHKQHAQSIQVNLHVLVNCTGLFMSLRDFQTRLRNNQDRHGRKEHINR